MRQFFLNHVWLINFYPPFLGAGIKMKKFWKDHDKIGFEVRLKLRFWNKNFAGTQFGGSLYSMCDPWYVFILAIYLGNDDYVLWDRSAEIEYIRPGKTDVTGIFEVDSATLQEIKNKIEEGEKFYRFETYLKDKDGEKIALVKKEVYIRPKSEN